MKRKVLFIISLHYVLLVVSSCCSMTERYIVKYESYEVETFNNEIVISGVNPDRVDVIDEGAVVMNLNYGSLNATTCRYTEYSRNDDRFVTFSIVSNKDWDNSHPAGADLKAIFKYYTKSSQLVTSNKILDEMNELVEFNDGYYVGGMHTMVTDAKPNMVLTIPVHPNSFSPLFLDHVFTITLEEEDGTEHVMVTDTIHF